MNQRRNAVACLIFVLMLIAISVGCEGSFDMVIENQTTQNLTVYLYNSIVGTIPAGEQIITRQPMSVNMFSITAKNSQGETVFSKTLSRQQMQRVDKKYKVVITTQSP